MENFYKVDTESTGTKSSTSPTKLFLVRIECNKLDKKKSEQFHKIVAKILFAANRDMPDIRTEISYLTTRVIEPD